MWVLEQLRDGAWYDMSLGDPGEWAVLMKRGYVRKVKRLVAFYRITAAGRKALPKRPGKRVRP